MADFNFVTERLATGAAVSSDDDVIQLINAGVTHVIDCRNDFDDNALLAKHPQIAYLFNGTPDDLLPKPPDWFQRSIEFALPAFIKPGNKVYAHCAAGINRGPSTALAIMLALGLDEETAEALIRKARPQVMLAYKNDAVSAVKVLGY